MADVADGVHSDEAEAAAADHDWHIDEAEYLRHERRRGRRFAYDPVKAGRTALLVIDLVPFFLHANPFARGIVPRVALAASGLRRAGGTVVWVDPSSGPPSDWQVGFFGQAIAEHYARSGSGDGSLSAISRERGDLVVKKRLPSPFSPGSSDLRERLGELGVTRLWVAGTVTSVCCESTVRDAAAWGFEVVLLADATADGSDAAHNAALRTVYRSFGDVRTTAEVVDELIPE